MRAEALSTSPWSLTGGERSVARREHSLVREGSLPARGGWNEQKFAEEQIRGLVRQVFFSSLKPPVKQVVFCAVEAETDTRNLCLWVGEVLARNSVGEVAVIEESESYSEWSGTSDDLAATQRSQAVSLRRTGTQLKQNLWSLPGGGTTGSAERLSLSALLAEVRREFEYSIVAVPAATVSSKVLDVARFSDGVILVLSAQRTRRVTALKVRSALTQVRLIGTVLSDREFPIPSSIYRRL